MNLRTLAVTLIAASVVDSALAVLLHFAGAEELVRLFVGAGCLCVSLALGCLSAAALLREVER